MSEEVMNAILGGIASATGSVFLKYLVGRVTVLSRHLASVSWLQFFTLGLAITAVLLTVPEWFVPEPGDRPQEIEQNAQEGTAPALPDPDSFTAGDQVVLETTVIAHTSDPSYDGVWQDATVSIPQIPAPAKFYPLSSLTCERGYTPVASWRQVVVTHPSMDILYTVEARLDDQGVSLGLRAREGRRGYAYIKVYLLCNRSAAGLEGSVANPVLGR